MRFRSWFTLSVFAWCAYAPFAQADSFNFQSIPILGAAGLNNADQISGWSGGGQGTQGAFYDGTRTTTFTVPGSLNTTRAGGLNNLGQIVGFYNAPDGQHGFLYTGGSFTSSSSYQNIDIPGQITHPQAINDFGWIVGTATGRTGSQGFLYDTTGFRMFDVPGWQNITPMSINNSGEVAGYYVDISLDATRGFLYKDGVFTTFMVPGSQSTYLTGINNLSDLVGSYNGSSFGDQGFIYRNGSFVTIDNSPTLTGSFLPGSINDSGHLVGTNINTVYLATPTPTSIPEPGPMLLVGFGLACLAMAMSGKRNLLRKK
ncbi:MAG: hypothetical protein ACJ73N_14950 [Bryobacteraceae bacterium]